MPFEPAVREQIKLRQALIGPSGSGKTRGMLDVATAVAAKHGGKIAVIDAENGRAKLYADRYAFDHMELADKSPKGYIAAIREAIAGRYAVLCIDGISPEWQSCLSRADKFGDWKTVGPEHDDFMAEISRCPLHLIVTMKAKMKYNVAEVESGGRTRQVITKLGVGPIMRDNSEYEFDILGYMDESHEAQWSNRCDPLVGTTSTVQAAAPVIVEWLEKGDPVPWKPPANVGESLERIGRFCDDAKPWLKEAVLARNAGEDGLAEFPAKYGDLPKPIRDDTQARLVEVVRSLDEHDRFDPYADAEETRGVLREAFSLGFGLKVDGPDPFHGPIPFG